MKTYDSEIFAHYYWFENASRLQYSSEVLLNKLAELYKQKRSRKVDSLSKLQTEQLSIFQSHMMLTGYALENLIKAVSVKSYTSQNKTISNFENLKKQVWQVTDTHNLIVIADKSNFKLTDEEKDLIKRHTEFIVWAGKYHIPKKKSKYDEVFCGSMLRRKKGDSKIIEDLFSRIKEYLDK